MNHLLNSDAAARQEALDCQRSFIVQAPAGSGKTGLLTQRLLKLLAMVEQPEEVVAITFTRKAAAEMQGRIIQALTTCQQGPPAEEHGRLTWQLAREVLRVDGERGWGVLANPARLRILTIDSLCRNLVSQMPIVSGLGGEAGLMADATPLYRLAARETLQGLNDGARWASGVRVVLEHLDNDRLTAEKLLASMLATRDQWLRHVVAEPDRTALEAALSRIVEAGLTACHKEFLLSMQEEVLPLARFAAGQLVAGEVNLLAPLLDLQQFPAAHPAHMAQWLAVGQLLLTQSGEWRRRLTVREGFPPNYKREKAQMSDLLERLSYMERLRQSLLAVRKLPPLTYEEGQWRVLEGLLTLLPVAAAQLWLLFSRQGKTDFSEISQRALLALGSGEEPTDLALRLDYRLRHLLVDEFQDTSLPQFRLLERLTGGWSDEDGRTLFLVGDPMQSIYRFREADVGLFLRARQRGIGGGVRLHPLTLQVNFRSCSQVVEWINGAFMHILPERDDPLTGAVGYVASTAHHGDADGEAGVKFHPLLNATPEQEAQRVVELACQALADLRNHSVAILVRSRSHVLWILHVLRQKSIPHHAVEIGRLAESMVVADLLSLTRLLMQPAERLSWLALFRSPCCGLTLADLTILAAVDEQVLWSGHEEGLSPQGKIRLPQVLAILTAAIARRRRGSLRLLVEGCWLALEGPATLRNPADWDDAMAFFQMVEEMEEAGEIRDLEELQRRLDSASSPGQPEEGGGVQVMTIHKAKGLEFDCVILPALARRPRRQENRLLLWQEISGERDGLLLAPVGRTGVRDEAIFDYLRWLDHNKEQLEVGRVLYVAATRSRRLLHLVASPQGDLRRKPTGGSFLAAMWEAISTMMDLPTPSEEECITPLPLQKEFPLFRLPADWHSPPPPVVRPGKAEPESVVGQEIDFQWAGESLRLVGVVVHRLLRRIGQEGLARWDIQQVEKVKPVIAAHLTALGLPGSEQTAAVEKVSKAISSTLMDERGRWLLAAPGQAELALTGVVDGQLRRVVIDRTFVDHDGNRWIVDYKTGYHSGADVESFLNNEQERYRGQLAGYAQLFRLIEERPIRLGLYFPLMIGWREWRADD